MKSSRRCWHANPACLQICFAYQGDIAFLINRGYYFQISKGRKTAIDSQSRNVPILVLVDELENRPENRSRIFEAVDSAMALSRNTITVYHERRPLHFPVVLFCPRCRKEYENPDENLFSFNSARGACPACKGLGEAVETAPGAAPCPRMRRQPLQPPGHVISDRRPDHRRFFGHDHR